LPNPSGIAADPAGNLYVTTSGAIAKFTPDGELISRWEPTEGVWIGVIEEIGQRLKELAARISLVIVEQHLELALAVAAYAYVLDRGRVALAGPSEEVKRDPQLLRYLAP